MFAIPEDEILSVQTCVMGYGWTISSNVFCRIMTYLPFTKNPTVSDSAAEAATNFKMLQFTCIGSFSQSRAHSEGMLHKKNILQRNCVITIQLDTTH